MLTQTSLLTSKTELLSLSFLQGLSLSDVLMNLTIKEIEFANTSNIEVCQIAIGKGAHAYALIFDDGRLKDIEDITKQFFLAPKNVLRANSHVFIATKEQFQLRD